MMCVPQIGRIEFGGGLSLKDVEVVITSRQHYVEGTSSWRAAALMARMQCGHLARQMPMLNVDADVETVARSAVRSPETRAAIKYLIASGAVAISIVEVDGDPSIRFGTKIDPRAVVPLDRRS
jgi:hypothetical protein